MAATKFPLRPQMAAATAAALAGGLFESDTAGGDESPVTITSYNTHGFPLQRQQYIKKLSLFSDVICCQEHFKLSKSKGVIAKSFNNNFELYFKSAAKSNDILSRGRASGGLFMAWRREIVKKVTRITVNNFRMQCVILEFHEAKLLLFNTYFPVDNQAQQLSDAQSSELHNLLSNIKSIMKEKVGKYDYISVQGDINSDFTKITGHTNAVYDFITNENLRILWESFPVQFTFCAQNRYSTIDHFFLSPNIIEHILEAGSVDDIENLSDHSPIYFKVKFTKSKTKPEICEKAPRITWSFSTEAQKNAYHSDLKEKLSNFKLNEDIKNCENMECTSKAHQNNIDELTENLLNCVTESAWNKLSSTSGTTGDQSSKRFTLPGWNHTVKPFHNEAIFWRNLWISSNKPIYSNTPGVEHDLYINMKKSRNNFHYAVRRAQKNVEKIKNDKLLNLGINSKEFFKELGKTGKCEEYISNTIDDVHGATNISEHFKNIYEKLYNEQNENISDIEILIKQGINSEKDDSAQFINLLTADVVKRATERLKNDKSDESGDFTSDCLKSAPSEFYEILSFLFRTYLMHGHISNKLLTCALSPIVKDSNGDIAASKNYRAIAISSLILKILDLSILLLIGHLLSNDELQYGFQKNCSTLQCTWAVQETISHFLRNGSETFSCLLDFSKAFDKVNFRMLFIKLIEKKVPFIVLRLLLFIYMNQTCYVKWNSKRSASFVVKNGVRQGAILSPTLFCTYLDTLLKKLKESGLGCHIGGVYLGAFGYADDIILLSPSRESLQLMLEICQDFATKHSMQFSTDPVPAKSKTKCLHFTAKKRKVQPLILNENELPWVDKASHLGNTLTTKITQNPFGMDTSADLLQKRAIFFQKVHELKQAFGFYTPGMILEIIHIFGCSFYGSPLWSLNSEEHLKLNRSWNTVIKMVWDLPFATHKRFLESLTNIPHLQSMLHGRYLGFIGNLKSTSKTHLQIIFNLCKDDLSCNTGQNIGFLSKMWDTQDLDTLISKKHLIKNSRINPLEEDEEWKINMIEEMCLSKLGLLDNEIGESDTNTMLEIICTE